MPVKHNYKLLYTIPQCYNKRKVEGNYFYLKRLNDKTMKFIITKRTRLAFKRNITLKFL